MNDNYKQLEEGFVKQAVDMGVEEAFIRGYIKQAQDVSDTWQEVIKEAEIKSNDPLFREKLAMEVLLAVPMLKQGEFSVPQDAEGWKALGSKALGGADSLIGSLGGMLGRGPGLGGMVAGGGGGALIGLLLSRLFNIDPMMGLLIGALGGGGLGGLYGKGMLGHKMPGSASEVKVPEAKDLLAGPALLNSLSPKEAPAGLKLDTQPSVGMGTPISAPGVSPGSAPAAGRVVESNHAAIANNNLAANNQQPIQTPSVQSDPNAGVPDATADASKLKPIRTANAGAINPTDPTKQTITG